MTDQTTLVRKPSILTPQPYLVEDQINRYECLARETGAGLQDILALRLSLFLEHHDLPVFNLQEVIQYLDTDAQNNNPNHTGWVWRPLREKDASVPLAFGKREWKTIQKETWTKGKIVRPVHSDFYCSNDELGDRVFKARVPRTIPYDRRLPIQVLEKVAFIEREFHNPIVFLVSDHQLDGSIQHDPDPFLMAVIPNGDLSRGFGRYVIDVWDEPGFGIDKMIK